MRLSIKAIAVFVLVSLSLVAGPPDFGQQQLRAAIGERHLALSIETELNIRNPLVAGIALLLTLTLLLPEDVRGFDGVRLLGPQRDCRTEGVAFR